MADPLLTAVFVAFFVGLTGLLGVTYIAFTRMDPDVRRARMFIMEKRIERFLGAFTIGFIALTVAIVLPYAGVTLPAAAEAVVVVLWLGGMAYGTYELFVTVRPPRGILFKIVRGSQARPGNRTSNARTDRSGSERDATK